MPHLLLLALNLENSPEAMALGAASVAAALSRAEARDFPRLSGKVSVELLEDLIPGEDPGARAEAIAARILERRPDWLGLSVYSWSRKAMAEVAGFCREKLPALLVFAGGPEATADPAGLFSSMPLDFIVRGEGELLTARALDVLLSADSAFSPIPVATREALGSLVGIALPGRTLPSSRALPEDLARLPSPWLSGFMKPREGGVLWELARGCPYRCSYCYESKGEVGLRRVPRQRIEAELDFFVRSGVSQAFVLDPTFDADRARARELLDLIGKKGTGIHWKFEARAELLDRDLARRFAFIDCSLQIGLQSADPEVSAAVGRPLDLKAFSRGLGHLNEAGVVYGIDLIYGLPKDSLAGFCRSMDFALGFQPNHLDIFPLAVLPGTELADRAGDFGLDYDAAPPHLLFSTPSFPPEAMAKARLLASACDLFYSRGRAVSWFLQALKPLKARPAAFLGRFAAVAEEDGLFGRDLSPAQLEAAQLAFLEGEYRAKGLEALIPALRDILRFNGAWGRALAEGESSELSLSYDPDEVLGPAALDLAAFARSARQRPARYLLKAGPGGPMLERKPLRQRTR